MASVLSSLPTVPLAVFGSASALVHNLSQSDSVLRMPLPLSRRIGFVSARGGSGTSATAAYVASILATRRRNGMVLGVNASAGPVTILSHAGLSPVAEHAPSELRANARSASDARDGLPVTSSGLFALDLTTESVAGAQASARSWFESLTPITRFFDVVATDWGVRSWQVDLAQIAAASHVVCLVARADRYSAEEAASLVPAIRAQEDNPRVVLALVDVGKTADRADRLVASNVDVPVVSIPFDSARGATRPIGSSTLGARTRIAYTELATTLMLEAQSPATRASEVGS